MLSVPQKFHLFRQASLAFIPIIANSILDSDGESILDSDGQPIQYI